MSEAIALVDRLSPLDASFLYLDDTTPGYVGSVAILEKPATGPLEYDELCRLVRQRLALVPRYRQKIKRVPGDLARPVWSDDASFDLYRHVRRTKLSAPGTPEQLEQLVARVCARRLDPRRPLWELYLVEGMADGRTAIVSKTHEALVDGAAVDLMQVLYDSGPTTRRIPAQLWRPAPERADLLLVADAVSELVNRPAGIADTLRSGLRLAGRAVAAVAGAATDVWSAASTAARPAPPTPLNLRIGERRRFAGLVTDLSDYRSVRSAYQVSVTDVVLATLAGGLRAWFMLRGERIDHTSVVRAMVPISVRAGVDGAAVGEGDARVSAVLIDLPIGEPNPVVRLHQIAYGLHTRRQAGHFVRADRMIALSGFAPPTLHALGARAVSRVSRRLANLVVSNVPGPQRPLYLAGARLSESYPVVPLGAGQALAVGVTSYDGRVCYGLNADGESMPDLDVLADLVEESLAELLETVK
jgi:WS/DGAT/MGAT family acyltransferase